MNVLILSAALVIQVGPERAVGDPVGIRYERAVDEPFPARAVPVELRPAVPEPAPVVAPLPPLPDQVFAPEPLPNFPAEVFAPHPLPADVFAPPRRRRIIRVVGPPDAPPPNPSPTPGIRRPEAEEALLQRLADVEARVDALERGATAKAPVPPVVVPQAAPPQAAIKGWRGLVGEPGVQGFGALNGAGQIVVEQRRYKAIPVATYATYQEPVVYQVPAPIYGAPYGVGFGSVCGPGGCGVSGRGIFGGLFR